jgi:hypothetical protein
VKIIAIVDGECVTLYLYHVMERVCDVIKIKYYPYHQYNS